MKVCGLYYLQQDVGMLYSVSVLPTPSSVLAEKSCWKFEEIGKYETLERNKSFSELNKSHTDSICMTYLTRHHCRLNICSDDFDRYRIWDKKVCRHVKMRR